MSETITPYMRKHWPSHQPVMAPPMPPKPTLDAPSSDAGGAAIAVIGLLVMGCLLISYVWTTASESAAKRERYIAAVCGVVHGVFDNNHRGRSVCITPTGRLYSFAKLSELFNEGLATPISEPRP